MTRLCLLLLAMVVIKLAVFASADNNESTSLMNGIVSSRVVRSAEPEAGMKKNELLKGKRALKNKKNKTTLKMAEKKRKNGNNKPKKRLGKNANRKGKKNKKLLKGKKALIKGNIKDKRKLKRAEKQRKNCNNKPKKRLGKDANRKVKKNKKNFKGKRGLKKGKRTLKRAEKNRKNRNKKPKKGSGKNANRKVKKIKNRKSQRKKDRKNNKNGQKQGHKKHSRRKICGQKPDCPTCPTCPTCVTCPINNNESCIDDVVKKIKEFKKAQNHLRMANRVTSWTETMDRKKAKAATVFQETLEALNTSCVSSTDGNTTAALATLSNCSISAAAACDPASLDTSNVESCSTTLKAQIDAFDVS